MGADAREARQRTRKRRKIASSSLNKQAQAPPTAHRKSSLFKKSIVFRFVLELFLEHHSSNYCMRARVAGPPCCMPLSPTLPYLIKAAPP